MIWATEAPKEEEKDKKGKEKLPQMQIGGSQEESRHVSPSQEPVTPHHPSK